MMAYPTAADLTELLPQKIRRAADGGPVTSADDVLEYETKVIELLAYLENMVRGNRIFSDELYGATPTRDDGQEGDLLVDESGLNLWGWMDGQWVLLGNIKGTAGTAILGGAGVPDNATGANGDWYFQYGVAAWQKVAGTGWVNRFAFGAYTLPTATGTVLGGVKSAGSGLAGNVTVNGDGSMTAPGMSGTVAVANGGTGATTQLGANQGLGTAYNLDVSKSADFTITAADRGKVFEVAAGSTDRTATLPSAATAGNGFLVLIRKADAGTGKVLVNGAALGIAGHTMLVWTDGTTWFNRAFFGAMDSSANLTISSANLTISSAALIKLFSATGVDFNTQKLLNVATGTAGTDGVNLGQVAAAVLATLLTTASGTNTPIAVGMALGTALANLQAQITTNVSLLAKSDPAFATLSYAASLTLDTQNKRVCNNTLTLTGNCALQPFSNLVSGATGLLKIVQDSTGGRTLTLPSGSLGSVVLNSSAAGVTMLSWLYDGTALSWTYKTY